MTKPPDSDARLARYRATLDAGGDPLVIAGWMAEVQAERLAAERDIGRSVPSQRLTKSQVRALISGVRDGVGMPSLADPKLKAHLYRELGLRLEYHPEEHLVKIEVPLHNSSLRGWSPGDRV